MLVGRSITASMLTSVGPLASLGASNLDVYTKNLIDPTTPRPIASWRAFADGVAKHATGDTGASLVYLISQTHPDWLVRGQASEFELMATEVSQSGTATRTGTLATWLALTSGRTYTLEKSNTTVEDTQWVLDIEIREVANTANTVTGRITFNANIRA